MRRFLIQGDAGKTGVVIGAGMGGLAAARALAPHFEQVTGQGDQDLHDQRFERPRGLADNHFPAGRSHVESAQHERRLAGKIDGVARIGGDQQQTISKPSANHQSTPVSRGADVGHSGISKSPKSAPQRTVSIVANRLSQLQLSGENPTLGTRIRRAQVGTGSAW